MEDPGLEEFLPGFLPEKKESLVSYEADPQDAMLNVEDLLLATQAAAQPTHDITVTSSSFERGWHISQEDDEESILSSSAESRSLSSSDSDGDDCRETYAKKKKKKRNKAGRQDDQDQDQDQDQLERDRHWLRVRSDHDRAVDLLCRLQKVPNLERLHRIQVERERTVFEARVKKKRQKLNTFCNLSRQGLVLN